MQMYAELGFFAPQLGQIFEANLNIHTVLLAYQIVASLVLRVSVSK